MFPAGILEPVKGWKKETTLKICLGIDIGGSGLRIRVSNRADPTQFVDLPHVPAHSTADTLKILNELDAAITAQAGDFSCSGAAFAIAGPIKDGVCILTNWAGDVELRTITLDCLPQKLCPRGKTVFLNDLEAGAYGVIAADDQGILEKNFTQLFADKAPKGRMIAKGRTAVMAMGSGLGAAMILKTPFLANPLVVPTEWGHMQIPLVCKEDSNCEFERELIQHISNHYHKGSQCPEFEDISSGRGLRLVYQFFKQKYDGEKLEYDAIDAGDVAGKAKAGEKAARDALLWHYLIFLRSAKNMAISLTCESILLALDNQVKNAWFVAEVEKRLEEEFYHFIRPDWMTGIRVYAQKEILNFNILGTSYMARQIAE